VFFICWFNQVLEVFVLELFGNDKPVVENSIKGRIILDQTEKNAQLAEDQLIVQNNKLNKTIKFNIEDLKWEDDDPKPQNIPNAALNWEQKTIIL